MTISNFFMRYELINFDVGEKPSIREFSVGTYKIFLVENYELVRKKLPSLARKRLQIESTNPEDIEWVEDARTGEYLVSAIVESVQEGASLLVKPNKLKVNSDIWDLCAILSYLTGRRVFLKSDMQLYSGTKLSFRVVDEIELIDAIQIAWSNRHNFGNERIIKAFIKLLTMTDQLFSEMKGVCAAIAIELITNSEEFSSKRQQAQSIDSVVARIKPLIESSDLEYETKSSLLRAMESWAINGLLDRFRTFLIKYNLITEPVSQETEKRIKSFNKMRNALMHGGDIYRPPWVTDINARTIIGHFMASEFFPLVAQHYINVQFGIEKMYLPRQSSRRIKDFFEKGIWNDRKIENLSGDQIAEL